MCSIHRGAIPGVKEIDLNESARENMQNSGFSYDVISLSREAIYFRISEFKLPGNSLRIRAGWIHGKVLV